MISNDDSFVFCAIVIMCENPETMGVQTNALEKENPFDSDTTSATDAPKLKRTFTLPRNLFGTTRNSKRKFQSKGNEEAKITNNEDKNKKVFRRPSIRKFINKIAQHINGVSMITTDNNRVPPVGLQTWGPEDTPGVTGLVNHGNTCFINAVLQCIAHTDILAEYFVLDKYKIDLSRRNKLNSKKFGSKGELTEQLALLLKALWACKYHPDLTIAFKQVVEKHGSQYKGRQQHDALEFLQWLLDKVHEDLNTASKRKFKSVKTSGKPDEVIAAETLENYKRCNNSFIQGVFQAQYRSSLSCSRCKSQSNTFDPFQCLSVQLPQVNKQSIYVTVVYTNQQPRQVKIGLSLQSGCTIYELRDMLQSDTSIEMSRMLITEIEDSRFHRTFSDSQCISLITEIDPIYCIETPELKDISDDTTSAYILLCWMNCVMVDDEWKRFGSPYCMQVSRELSYEDLQKLILKEMACILHDDVLTSNQSKTIFKMRISDPACDENEPYTYIDPELEHPLFMEALDQALALCSDDGGPPHVKVILEWDDQAKKDLIADDTDQIEEHSSVKHLKTYDMQGAPLTLEECLRDYTGAETLTDAWRCTHCQQYQPVIKTLGVWSLPDILIVHFKRFRQQSLRGTNSTKLTTMVEFPVCGLDMSPHLANKCSSETIDGDQVLLGNNWSPWKKSQKHSTASDSIYDLYAVCYHHGTSLGTGHYTAACKNPYNGQWYLYDDAKVTNLSRESDDMSSLLVNNSAYILFYQRRGGYYSSSSNSSSAASTSSVSSSVDHWISRMPRFIPPKHLKIETPVTNNKENVEGTEEITEKDNIDVALRNSQNALKTDSSNSIPKFIDESSNMHLEHNSQNDELRPDSRIESDTENIPPERNPLEPIYRTSIYINSEGEADIKTTSNISPVLSPLRLNHVSEDDIEVTLRKVDNKMYFSSVSVQRHSDRGVVRNIETSNSNLNCMSPLPRRTQTQSQLSM